MSIDYLLVGPATIDLIPTGTTLGGTVSYVAPLLHSFGMRAGILTSAQAGHGLLDELQQFADVHVKLATHTTTMANIYETRERRQEVHAVANMLTYEDIPTGWLSAPIVHLAPLVNRVDPAIVHRFPNSLILLTPQGWMRKWGDDRTVRFQRWFDPDIVRAADLVVFSRHDIQAAPDLEDEFARLAKYLVITDGVRGGIVYQNGVPSSYDAYPVEEQEPTGAGDVFAASLIASLSILDQNMRQAVQVAARLAAIAVTRSGLRGVPTPDEVQAALKEVQDD